MLRIHTSLQEFGLVPFFAQQLTIDEIEQSRVARVIAVQRSNLTVFDGAEERMIPLISARHSVASDEHPTVGDWVVLDNETSRIQRILTRKSVFQRIAAGNKAQIQLIAANIDVLFIVTSCNEEFKESRLERYLTLAAEAAVIPVVVLTKIDLVDDVECFVDRVRRIQASLAVESINCLDKNALDGVKAWIECGTSVALVGSSGVGKSTLLNTLAGRDIAATKGIRENDKKGRHTTTHRALYQLANGGLVIDVPGIRELKVAEVDDALANVFQDIEAISLQCRFTDCQHESEPDCAVRDAIKRGDLDARRLANYQKLLRENKRNTSSLSEKRSQDRAFAKRVKQVTNLKQRK